MKKTILITFLLTFGIMAQADSSISTDLSQYDCILTGPITTIENGAEGVFGKGKVVGDNAIHSVSILATDAKAAMNQFASRNYGKGEKSYGISRVNNANGFFTGKLKMHSFVTLDNGGIAHFSMEGTARCDQTE